MSITKRVLKRVTALCVIVMLIFCTIPWDVIKVHAASTTEGTGYDRVNIGYNTTYTSFSDQKKITTVISGWGICGSSGSNTETITFTNNRPVPITIKYNADVTFELLGESGETAGVTEGITNFMTSGAKKENEEITIPKNSTYKIVVKSPNGDEKATTFNFTILSIDSNANSTVSFVEPEALHGSYTVNGTAVADLVVEILTGVSAELNAV